MFSFYRNFKPSPKFRKLGAASTIVRASSNLSKATTPAEQRAYNKGFKLSMSSSTKIELTRSPQDNYFILKGLVDAYRVLDFFDSKKRQENLDKAIQSKGETLTPFEREELQDWLEVEMKALHKLS